MAAPPHFPLPPCPPYPPATPATPGLLPPRPPAPARNARHPAPAAPFVVIVFPYVNNVMRVALSPRAAWYNRKAFLKSAQALEKQPHKGKQGGK